MKTQNATPRKPLGLSSTHENQWGGWAAMKAPRLDLGGIPRISRDPLGFDELMIKPWNHEIMKSNWSHDLIYEIMKSWKFDDLIWKLHMKISYENIKYEIAHFDDLMMRFHEIWYENYIWKLHMKITYEIDMKHEIRFIWKLHMKIIMKTWEGYI